ncbi:hypothetical protein Y032_0003g1532 [Ancylostoma ceylanicum]|uniref:Homologous-pairing protein 2 winged helix domain-containing protein n=1 Tax=Ancylostoma ceylanicum TaxID=53326 RepID=A0A016VZ93_9BILA|nr:hypothetical protein Y032_0003g1532 [Ancylostoma ceylanicum]
MEVSWTHLQDGKYMYKVFRKDRSKKYLPPASTARLLSRAAPSMHYHTCCDVAQSTRSVAGGKYFLERMQCWSSAVVEAVHVFEKPLQKTFGTKAFKVKVAGAGIPKKTPHETTITTCTAIRCKEEATHNMSKADLEEKASVKIPEYMKEQNRPYSAIDVYTNLRQEFGKTLVLKVLEASVASGVLKEKLVGKQKIFYANQDNLEEYDEAAIAEYDAKINELSEKLTGISAQHKELQNELKVLSGMQTTQQLQKLTSELKEKISRMKSQLAKFEESDNTAVAEDGKRAMELEANMSKLLVKRKRIATDMLNAISECSPLKKSELLGSIGVELEPGEW